MRPRRLLVAALLCLLFQTSPAATGAMEGDSADSPTVVPESNTQTPADGARSDLELAAELDGISVEEAAEVQAARDVLSSIIAELERARPGAVTGSISPTTDLPGILYVHGTLSLMDRKRIEDLGFIVSDGQPLSMQDVKNQRASVASALTDAGIKDFTIHGPPDGSAILVPLRGPDANLTAATLALPPDIENKTSFRISDGLPGEWEGQNGGLQFEPARTSGFTL